MKGCLASTLGFVVIAIAAVTLLDVAEDNPMIILVLKALGIILASAVIYLITPHRVWRIFLPMVLLFASAIFFTTTEMSERAFKEKMSNYISLGYDSAAVSDIKRVFKDKEKEINKRNIRDECFEILDRSSFYYISSVIKDGKTYDNLDDYLLILLAEYEANAVDNKARGGRDGRVYKENYRYHYRFEVIDGIDTIILNLDDKIIMFNGEVVKE